MAVKGGILPAIINGDVDGFSVYPHRSFSVSTANGRAYSKFFKPVLANRAKGEVPPSTVEGDLLESFEISPDGLTITGRMRPNAGLDPRPPTNGRNLNTEDVLYSWDKIRELSKTRGLIANEASPTAPVLSITTPDDQTVVFNLAHPSPSILPNLGFTLFGNFVYPVEAESDFDANVEMRGSGPWLLDKYEPSVTFQYRRNPNYYDSSRPYLDGVDLPDCPGVRLGAGAVPRRQGLLHGRQRRRPNPDEAGPAQAWSCRSGRLIRRSLIRCTSTSCRARPGWTIAFDWRYR